MAVLENKRLLIVSGKGGVGKSTVAAALAWKLSQRGLRTLAYEVNTDERISGLLGHKPVGPDVTQLEENLWAVNARPQEALKEYALMIIKFERVYKAVFDNKLVRYFLRFVGGVQELVLLGKVLFHLQEKRDDGTWTYDRIVLDAPATGHAVTLLGVAQVVIDTVPPGPMSREAETMRDLLVNEKVTAGVLVSLPEEMPVNETIDLHKAFREKLRIRTQAVVLNAAVEHRFSHAELQQLEKVPAVYPAARGHELRAEMTDDSKRKLAAGTGLPVAAVPRLWTEKFGRSCVIEVAEHLTYLLEEP